MALLLRVYSKPTAVDHACIIITVFTWLNAVATITLVPKIGAATVQTRPPFDTRNRCLNHYFHNRLPVLLSAVIIQGAASNQVNTV